MEFHFHDRKGMLFLNRNSFGIRFYLINLVIKLLSSIRVPYTLVVCLTTSKQKGCWCERQNLSWICRKAKRFHKTFFSVYLSQSAILTLAVTFQLYKTEETYTWWNKGSKLKLCYRWSCRLFHNIKVQIHHHLGLSCI